MWEYRAVWLGGAGENLQDQLNGFGRQGWELITASRGTQPLDWFCFFKRRKGKRARK